MEMMEDNSSKQISKDTCYKRRWICLFVYHIIQKKSKMTGHLEGNSMSLWSFLFQTELCKKITHRFSKSAGLADLKKSTSFSTHPQRRFSLSVEKAPKLVSQVETTSSSSHTSNITLIPIPILTPSRQPLYEAGLQLYEKSFLKISSKNHPYRLNDAECMYNYLEQYALPLEFQLTSLILMKNGLNRTMFTNNIGISLQLINNNMKMHSNLFSNHYLFEKHFYQKVIQRWASQVKNDLT